MRIWYRLVVLGSMALLGLTIILLYTYAEYSDNKLHVIFCNVGQGDGIFIRTPNGSNILIDGGPNDNILNCISSHTPFWDRTINLMLLTHPHEDHLYGLISVLQRYNTIYFGSENLANKTVSFKKLTQFLKAKRVDTHFLYQGDKIKTKDGLVISIIGPSKTFLSATSPNGIIEESGEFASLENYFQYEKFRILFTGDSQTEELIDAIQRDINTPIDILQIPHHGSKYGISQAVLDKLKPRLCIISVGQNNRYGHPSDQAVSLAKNNNCQIFRTDERGDIEIITDGNKWRITGLSQR